MNRVIALGTFDGLHPGHRAVINACCDIAAQKGASPMVYTFWENPRALFASDPLRLMSAEEKITRMLEMGAREVAADHFDEELRSLSPEEFVLMLKARFSPVAFVCGEDYSFGRGGSGKSRELTQISLKCGIETYIVPTVKILTREGASNEKVSSSAIREALKNGDEIKAAKLMRGEAI